MTLSATGTLAASNINTELGVAATSTLSLGGASSRSLAGISTGQISLNAFHSKSNSGPPIKLGYLTSAQAITDARLAAFTSQTATALPCTISIAPATSYYTYIAVPVSLGFVRFWDVGTSNYLTKGNAYSYSFIIVRYGTVYYNLYKLSTVSLGARTLEIHADSTTWNPAWPDASWTFVGRIEAHASNEVNDFHLDTTLNIGFEFNQLAFDDTTDTCAVNMDGGADSGWLYGPGVIERVVDPSLNEYALDMGLNTTAARGDCPRFYILRSAPVFPLPSMTGAYKAFDKGRTFMLDFDSTQSAGSYFFQDSQPSDAANNYGDAVIDVYARLNV